ncbi:uncharacterized protein Z519_12746 [Cladophialophora bantiana CBS 173.52]|uniref:Uncharacterized protein n=1 Tax=Cladophialophora bantiana (strain ATCC 10958 / CBS 173.52 / CDC B-1940 / NIH 8579) TaxID=1442370 RepID=A0A0D2E931_CLAB1|nr:uncharacterized protein Z519_12746 [Cladophialophora bantiana CBS 173.52]KIW86621.1 hypothetical protein Z519_12746 [Cladophialophora bantiana CBS 173.52]
MTTIIELPPADSEEPAKVFVDRHRYYTYTAEEDEVTTHPNWVFIPMPKGLLGAFTKHGRMGFAFEHYVDAKVFDTSINGVGDVPYKLKANPETSYSVAMLLPVGEINGLEWLSCNPVNSIFADYLRHHEHLKKFPSQGHQAQHLSCISYCSAPDVVLVQTINKMALTNASLSGLETLAITCLVQAGLFSRKLESSNLVNGGTKSAHQRDAELRDIRVSLFESVQNLLLMVTPPEFILTQGVSARFRDPDHDYVTLPYGTLKIGDERQMQIRGMQMMVMRNAPERDEGEWRR